MHYRHSSQDPKEHYIQVLDSIYPQFLHLNHLLVYQLLVCDNPISIEVVVLHLDSLVGVVVLLHSDIFSRHVILDESMNILWLYLGAIQVLHLNVLPIEFILPVVSLITDILPLQILELKLPRRLTLGQPGFLRHSTLGLLIERPVI